MPPVKVYWYDGVKANTDPNLKDETGRVRETVPNRPLLADVLEKKHNRQLDRSHCGGGTIYVGTRGIMVSGNYGDGPRIVPEEAHRAFPPPDRTLPRVKGTHFAHFLQCCKERKPTCADFAYGAAITEFLLLGHLALRAGVGGAAEWDGPGMKCTNHPELNRWLARECRKGW
jgi:hypothetical protein